MYDYILSAVGVLVGVQAQGDLPPLYLTHCLPSATRTAAAMTEIERWAGKLKRVDANGLELPWRPGGPRVELSWRYWAWQQVWIARHAQASDWERRHAFRALINYWGWQAVLTGQVPTPIPLDWYALAP